MNQWWTEWPLKMTWTGIETRSSRAQWGTTAQTLWRLSRAAINEGGSGKPSHEVHGRSRDRLHDDYEECRLQAQCSCVTSRRLRIHFRALPWFIIGNNDSRPGYGDLPRFSSGPSPTLLLRTLP